MKKLITISAILLSLLSFAQDTLMTFDFRTGAYDSNIFTNMEDFTPSFDSSYGAPSLVIQSPNGEVGPFEIELNIDTTLNTTYDSICITRESSFHKKPWGKHVKTDTLYYTKNTTNMYGQPLTIEYKIHHRMLYQIHNWDDAENICTNCNRISPTSASYYHNSYYSLDIDYFSRKPSIPDLQDPFNDNHLIYHPEFDTIFIPPYNNVGDFRYPLIKEPNTPQKAIDDFCYLVASDIGRNEFDYNIAFDCLSQNTTLPFNRYDFYYNHALSYINIIGYKSRITSTNETILSNNTKTPIKYLNTQGIEIKKENLQPNTFYISIYRDGQKEKFMIVE